MYPGDIHPQQFYLPQHGFPPRRQNDLGAKAGIMIRHLLPNPRAGSGQEDAGAGQALLFMGKRVKDTEVREGSRSAAPSDRRSSGAEGSALKGLDASLKAGKD